jgi:hypothetical protein
MWLVISFRERRPAAAPRISHGRVTVTSLLLSAASELEKALLPGYWDTSRCRMVLRANALQPWLVRCTYRAAVRARRRWTVGLLLLVVVVVVSLGAAVLQLVPRCWNDTWMAGRADPAMAAKAQWQVDVRVSVHAVTGT